jgi:peptidoglycan/LPS O-acetylase OafA/YrhL
MKTTQSVWFPGINGLRFIAASLVILMHLHSSLVNANLPHFYDLPVFYKGLYAVSFFFVLSGFLITYLLLQEKETTGKIKVKKFYMRRVLRIWPLYFIIVIIGLIFYWKLVPVLGLNFKSEYPKSLALVLYLFFLSNIMNSFYHVGGILHVTWSIAVEEQFYLFWAPLFKKVKKNLPTTILIITSLSFLLSVLNTLNVFELKKGYCLFISTLQFHYMGIGALAAWLLFNHNTKLLNTIAFRSKAVQGLLTLFILCFLFFYQKNVFGEILLTIPIGILFAWLIVNVAANPNKLFSLESSFLNYTGKISYGIYMYHMIIVYVCVFLFEKLQATQNYSLAFVCILYFVVFDITILIAGCSYKFVEKPLLNIK